ncbi:MULTISPECIES: hypothetical protein [Enterobacterales]|uniref:hypothetical protein n=1 Tax=Enterobacterales TaxID=91347 RepID=UPI002ED90106
MRNYLPLRNVALLLLFLALLFSLDKIFANPKASASMSPKPTEAKPSLRSYAVEMPALPFIQNTIAAMTPVFPNDPDNKMIKGICALAQGQLSQSQANDWLKGLSIDSSKIPAKGSNLSLLVNGDKKLQAAACAAYVSSSVFSLVTLSDFAIAIAPPAREKKSKNAPAATPSSPKWKMDDARLQQYLKTKLSAAKANADFYVFIAIELAKKHGLTPEEYGYQIQQLFTTFAPYYLRHFNELYNGSPQQYKVVNLTEDELDFISSDGYHFIRNDDGVIFKYNNIMWYGGGYLIGKYYTMNARYSGPELATY